jgi:hypothetical protein
VFLIVVDGDLAFADHFEQVAANDQPGIRVDADPEQLRMGVENVHQFVFPPSGDQVRVDDDVLQEPEPAFVALRHQKRLVRPPAHNERTLDDGTGRFAADDSAAVEHGP